MENKTLLEEVQKFKKLSGIINEAGGPASWVSSLISKITKTALSDAVIKEFEPLINAGKIAINRSNKMITSINWQNLTDDEVKLLFKSDEFVTIMDDIIKANGIRTSKPALASYKGNFKKIMDGYVAGKVEPRIGSGSGSIQGSTTTNVVNTAGKYTGNIVDKLNNLFRGKIDDATLQKILDKKSQLRLDLENELKLKVGKDKAHLVPGAIDKAAKRVSELTDGLTEQTAYNKVFETAFTQIGIRKTNSELFRKYFGWFLKLPWWGQAIGSAIFLSEVLNPLLGTNYSLLGMLKWVLGTTKEGAIGDTSLKTKWDESVDRLKKSTGPENAPQKDNNSGKDVTTY